MLTFEASNKFPNPGLKNQDILENAIQESSWIRTIIVSTFFAWIQFLVLARPWRLFLAKTVIQVLKNTELS